MLINHPKAKDGHYYIENALWDQIKHLPKRIEKDKDALAFFVGVPGEGKSTMAQQLAYPLDNNLSCHDIMYSSEDYIKRCCHLFEQNTSKGRAIIHDEGREVASAGLVNTKKTRLFAKFLYENRQMNMYQFILTGDFFDIPMYLVMQRGLFMVYVHEEGEFENGHFKFYNRKDMRLLYMKGKKFRDMGAHKSSDIISGGFPKFYTVDEDEYRKLKRDHIELDRYIDGKPDKEVSIQAIVNKVLDSNPAATAEEFERLTGFSHDAVRMAFKRYFMGEQEQ